MTLPDSLLLQRTIPNFTPIPDRSCLHPRRIQCDRTRGFEYCAASTQALTLETLWQTFVLPPVYIIDPDANGNP